MPLSLFAQTDNGQAVLKDSIQEEVKISITQLTGLENAKEDFENKLKKANVRITELEKKIMADSVAQKKSDTHISNLRADSVATHNEMKRLKEQLLKADKCLISVASNFLYIPYEAYSVDSIAIRSFATVSDKSLKEKYAIRFSLLKNYKKDIMELSTFLERITQKSELGGPFASDAKEQIASLHNQRFYIEYNKYDDWKSTFLGGIINTVEQQLSSFNKGNKDSVVGNLTKIASQLSAYIK